MKQNPTLNHEQSLWDQGLTHVVGIDEVGRGCLAGPIVVGAVIFDPSTTMIDGVRDSKLLTADQRLKLVNQIKEQALTFSLGVGSVEMINNQGIVPALKFAIHEALQQLTHCQHLLIDGQPFTSLEYDWPPADYIIKGDQLSYSIAAASILAKVYRDNLMKKLAAEFPHYGWDTNVGYGTKPHQMGLRQHGPCVHHRDVFIRKTLA